MICKSLYNNTKRKAQTSFKWVWEPYNFGLIITLPQKPRLNRPRREENRKRNSPKANSISLYFPDIHNHCKLLPISQLHRRWPNWNHREERRGREKKWAGSKSNEDESEDDGSEGIERKSDMGERMILSDGDGDEEEDELALLVEAVEEQ